MTDVFVAPESVVTDTPEHVAAAPVRAEAHTAQPRVAARPWSAVICGRPDDNTLLIVDWLLLACRAAGFVAHAVPLLGDDRSPHGMYLEVAATAEDEAQLSGTPWGSVDLVVAGEHLELVRAITAGYVDRDATVVVASCKRAFTQVEHAVAPQHVLSEREIDELARVSARAYHAFDGPEVARWYGLPASAQAGLLLGAVFGTGATSLEEQDLRAGIEQLGIDAPLQLDALRRGRRLGRRAGGRIRRPRTAYQFTRRRRIHVAHESRIAFDQLVERAESVVAPEHLPALQDAIYQLTLFQDAAWATRLVDHVADIMREEHLLLGDAWTPERSVVPDSIRSLAALMTWQDGAWIAATKRREGRHKQLRAAHGITRGDRYQLIEHIPLDAVEQAELKAPKLRGNVNSAVPAILRPMQIERIDATTISGAMKLRRMAAAAKWRAGSERQLRELDTAETWLSALFDAMRADIELGRIVARSGTLVQGSGAVRDANRQTALAFWGRIVRQTLSIDRQVTGSPTKLPEQSIARVVIPFVWNQLARSGPLALWEYATPVVQIAMARSRGVTHEQAYAHAVELCGVRRPLHSTAS